MCSKRAVRKWSLDSMASVKRAEVALEFARWGQDFSDRGTQPAAQGEGRNDDPLKFSADLYLSTSRILSYCKEKNPDTRHAGGGHYGNGIFHCVLRVKEMALFHLAQIEPKEDSLCFVL
ncbi:hypothetical protein AVEN_6010-1 [Araneus ventricosus]|uniref:Uncharacterized protein n=1 Tax=Araneus ventricosus TaxID=182803 RepID=A0A4Y2RZN9_ARAVE|nr:hypothetical protein AVEN_6010-1 [Araneus ventricosus]